VCGGGRLIWGGKGEKLGAFRVWGAGERGVLPNFGARCARVAELGWAAEIGRNGPK